VHSGRGLEPVLLRITLYQEEKSMKTATQDFSSARREESAEPKGKVNLFYRKGNERRADRFTGEVHGGGLHHLLCVGLLPSPGKGEGRTDTA